MLHVADNSAGYSYAYVSKDLEDIKRRDIGVSFEVTPSFALSSDVYLAVFRSLGGTLMTAVALGPEGIKMKAWNYATMPGPRLIPPFLPNSTRDTVPPFTPPYMPANAQPQDRLLVNSATGTFRVEVRVSNPHSYRAEAYVYAEKVGGKLGSGYIGPVNWKLSNVGRIDVGCVYARDTAYDLNFNNLLSNGDVPDPNWFNVQYYSGFSVDPADEDKLWIGAGDIMDAATYSEETKLTNLARYDYARVVPTETLEENPKGLRWSMT